YLPELDLPQCPNFCLNLSKFNLFEDYPWFDQFDWLISIARRSPKRGILIETVLTRTSNLGNALREQKSPAESFCGYPLAKTPCEREPQPAIAAVRRTAGPVTGHTR
ncbi:MAG TPA: hypothetical protein PKG95_05290, partial [Anaerolineaceae bacterium]|nr:hypothetical protein [Anaerolineaceae bacterium]